MAEKRHLQNVRSKVVDGNGKPKLPSSLLYGELAINYHKGTETISIQNDSDEIVSFHDEVEISSAQPKVNTEIWIDLSDSAVTEVYTKQQIDSQMSGVTNDLADIHAKDNEQDARITALENKDTSASTKIDEVSGAVETLSNDLSALSEVVANNIVIGISGGTDTEILIDTTNEGDPYEVYTKAQVDSMVAYLQAQIDKLKNS